MRRSLTYEKCREEVSKYNSYTELNQTDPSVINKIRSKGWFDLLSHWETPHSPKNPKWTYEKCKEEISKLTYLNELQGTSLLGALKNNDWFNELTVNLIRQNLKPISDDDIKIEALKYNTRAEFQKKSNSHYSAALRKGIVDEVCSHMGKHDTLKRKYLNPP